jgi:hypothetical protein
MKQQPALKSTYRLQINKTTNTTVSVVRLLGTNRRHLLALPNRATLYPATLQWLPIFHGSWLGWL